MSAGPTFTGPGGSIDPQSVELDVAPEFLNADTEPSKAASTSDHASFPLPNKLGNQELGQDLELEDASGRSGRHASGPDDEALLILSARKVSMLSIVVSLVLAFLGFGIGLSENVLSVIGFGMEASLDGISSALVMWRFKTGKKREFRDAEAAAAAKEARDARRERNSAVGIGVTFCASAFFLTISAAWKVFEWDPETPEHLVEEHSGAIYTSLLAWPSCAIFMYLAVWKFRLSKQLGSQVLRKDALCSVLGAFLALICALAALLEQVVEGNPKAVSGVDAAASLGIALILAFEGLRTLKHNLWDWETEHVELA